MSAPMEKDINLWTDVELTETAQRYSSRAEFAQKKPECYRAALRNGHKFFNDICKHMDRGTATSNRAQVRYPNYSSLKPQNQKIIPVKADKRSIVEFLQEESSQGKFASKIHQYHVKNNQQVKLINQSHNNFVKIMGDKMSSNELTYVRFKQIVDTAVKAMSEQNDQSVNLLKTLVIMDNAHFSDDAVYEKNFKLLDNNFNENEKNISIVFDITLKLSQMKNKDSLVEHKSAIDELGNLQNNIDRYIK